MDLFKILKVSEDLETQNSLGDIAKNSYRYGCRSCSFVDQAVNELWLATPTFGKVNSLCVCLEKRSKNWDVLPT